MPKKSIKARKTAKKAASKKLAKKTGAKKTTPKKAAKKTATKKMPAKKVATKKTPAKKSVTKKTTKKPVAKKTAAKKAVTKKTVTKKSVKKPAAKKTPTKKIIAKPIKTKKPKITASKKIKDIKAETKIKKVSPTQIKTETLAPYQPKKTEKYMSKKMRAHFRQLLTIWKQQLMEKVDTTMQFLQDDVGSLPDLNDRATQEEEFSLELRTRDRERKLIKKIEEATEMIDEQTYGYCEACGEEIGLRRLEARPTATLCIDCKTLDEIRERQRGG